MKTARTENQARRSWPSSAAAQGGSLPTLRIQRSWDEALFQTDKLRPAYSAAVLLTWTMDSRPDDAGVPTVVTQVVSQVATSIGRVAFRLFFRPDLSTGVTRLPVSRPWLPVRIYQALTRTWPVDVAIADEAPAALQMFSQHWQLQGQLALVLRDNNPNEKTLHRLRHARDWRDGRLPQDVHLLIAPAVDGDGILLATASAAEMDQAVGLLLQAFEDAGLSCRGDAAPGAEPTEMDITVSHHVDASEPDAQGFYEYHYEYDVYRFSRAGRTYIARSYVDEPQSAAFLSCLEGSESRLLSSADLVHPLLVAAVDHLRGIGKAALDRLAEPEGYVALEVPLPLPCRASLRDG